KMYTTRVAIKADELEGLEVKPGMSAEVTIIIADSLKDVLVVPVQAVIGGSEMGSKRSIVVMTPDGPRERKIVIGGSNEKLAEVKEYEVKDGEETGLKEGDTIVLNPKSVL